MKYLSSQFGFLFSEGEARANLGALIKYLAFLALLVTVYAVAFHLAADRELIERAGVAEVASVVLTTNDDAMNVYLAVYCRKLNRNLPKGADC